MYFSCFIHIVIFASVAQSVEQRIIGGIYGDGFALKDTKASRKYMPDSKDVMWENIPKNSGLARYGRTAKSCAPW